MIYRVLLKLRLSIKIFVSNKLRFFLTISGMSLGLLIMICGIEVINAYTESEYKKIKYVDKNVLMISSDSHIRVSDAIYKLEQGSCDYSYSYYKKAIDSESKGYLYKDSRIDCNLNLLAASYNFEKGYMCFADENLNYCGRVNMICGQSFSKEQYDKQKRVCIIENSTSELLFGMEAAIGKSIEIEINGNNYKFEIIGIIEDTPTTSKENLVINANIRKKESVIAQRNVIVPLSWYNNNYENVDRSTSNVIFYFDEHNMYKGKDILRTVGYGTDNISVIDYNSILFSLREFINLLKNVVDVLLICIFLIAGLIVMNALFFSVKERIREIGIRRALGANSRDIILQILLESVIQGIIAYMFTLFVSNIFFVLVSYYALYFLGVDFILSIHSSTYIVLLSAAIMESFVFSLLPGIYAMKIKPTEAIIFT